MIWALFTYFTSLSWFEHYLQTLLLCLDLSTIYRLYFPVLIWELCTCFTSLSWFENCLYTLLLCLDLSTIYFLASMSWFEHCLHALLLCLDLSTVYMLYFYVLIWALFTCFTSMSWFEHYLQTLLLCLDLNTVYMLYLILQDQYGNNCYIASQGPVPNTVYDFWRMILQYKVKVVAMACRLIEMGRVSLNSSMLHCKIVHTVGRGHYC